MAAIHCKKCGADYTAWQLSHSQWSGITKPVAQKDQYYTPCCYQLVPRWYVLAPFLNTEPTIREVPKPGNLVGTRLMCNTTVKNGSRVTHKADL